MDTKEFLKTLNKGIGVGFVQGAKKKAQDDAIAKEVYRIYGEGEILNSALKQLGMVMIPGNPPTFSRDPEAEALKRESLGEWYSYDKTKMNDYPEMQNLSTDELIEHLKTETHLLGLDGEGDPDKVEGILAIICLRISEAMDEDHCCFLEEAVRSIGYHSGTHPTACDEWKRANRNMCDRVLKSIYGFTCGA